MSAKKSLDVKAILDQIERLAAKYPEVAELLPEFANQGLQLLDVQSNHDREMELARLKIQERERDVQNTALLRGQIYGFIVGMTAIISGAVTASMGSQWAGGFIGGGGVIGLVSVFVLGRRKP